MTLHSFAKLNLYLKIFSKRKDKYHNLKTIFERIDLSDRITFEPRKDKKIKIFCSNPQVPTGKSNLCYQSAKLLQDKFNIEKGVNIKINKRIPVSAGLGGGSSNAACVFLGLNKLWKLNLPLNRFIRLSEKIGCDVPFFIYKTSFALATQRGDKIEPLRIPKTLGFWHIVIIPRNLRIQTEEIYKKFDEYSKFTPLDTQRILKDKHLTGLTSSKYDVKLLNLALRKKEPNLLSGLLFNNLEDITFRLYPEVALVKKELKGLGLQSILMSGSGPAVFGIVSSRKEALSVRDRLKKMKVSWKVFVTRTV